MSAGEMAKRLDAEVLGKMERLDLAARFIVEGFLSGGHRSPYKGFSVEFSQHRQYVAGDDTRHIDWKAYGKTERYYLKEYQQETNLRAVMLVDTSESMAFRGEGLSKLDYGKLAAAALTYVVLDQQDMVAVMGFADRVVPVTAPTGEMSAFYDMCEAMLSMECGGKGDVGAALHQAAGLLKRRGVVVVISDFLSDVGETVKGLEHLRFEGHDVIALQILDHAELEFDMRGMCLFEGLEGGGEVLADAGRVRGRYRAAMGEFLETLQAGCVRTQADYLLADTSESLDKVLAAYLLARGRRG